MEFQDVLAHIEDSQEKLKVDMEEINKTKSGDFSNRFGNIWKTSRNK